MSTPFVLQWTCLVFFNQIVRIFLPSIIEYLAPESSIIGSKLNLALPSISFIFLGINSASWIILVSLVRLVVSLCVCVIPASRLCSMIELLGGDVLI